MSEKPIVLVACEKIDNESFCVSIIRELAEHYQVRPFGPNWEAEELSAVDSEGARFLLELDSASGLLWHARGLERIHIPKFAWLIDTHKKPDFHRAIARDMDHVFFTMKTWGHVFEREATWLPLHADQTIFHPVERERDFDVVFVGSYGWRAAPLERIARAHGLKLHLECTTGPREKSRTAELYARSRIVFNKHVANDLNFRMFEATACGRVLLSDAQWNGQYELFEDGKHLALYKDERDLEAKILHYLSDEAARTRLEHEAAAHAQEHHTTRARVAQLRALVEARIAARPAPTPPSRVTAPGWERPAAKQRWLFFVERQPATVERTTYAEGLARELARRGHDVIVARARDGAFPRPSREETEGPTVLELGAGPLPRGTTSNNELLAAAGPLHRCFAAAAREQAAFDAVVGEGALGALIAQPLAERAGVPFILALDACEVERRANRLTREQLHVAELEHWGCDRASAVVVPREETSEAARSHYGAATVLTVGASEPTKRELPRDTERLLKTLGFQRNAYTAFLAQEPGDAEVARVLGESGPALVLGAKGAWEHKAGSLVQVARQPVSGCVLAALLGGARRVVTLAARDARIHEARRLGVEVEGEAPAAPERALDVSALEALVCSGEALAERTAEELTRAIQ